MVAFFLVTIGNLGWNFSGERVLAANCNAPANAIVAENCLTGNLPSDWDITGIGDSSIQGFATDISYNRGQRVDFKIKTPATQYRLDIYRMGYYGGRGARKVNTVNVNRTSAQNQPNCSTNTSTGLVDCGNWAVSASWDIPSTATSGIYFAKAVRSDTGGASHIVFIVRDDSSTSDILFQTSDTTWQAYNSYGGNSLYTGSPAGRAYKVSYNRPFNTRIVDNGQDWLFNAEYPMVRWLEANGYSVSYFTGVDSDRYGDLIKNHKIFLSVGHDEYWSKQQRDKVEAARNVGVNLGFFSGNEIFWKTRWENSIANPNSTYRTLVCYKETKANAIIDPQPNIWTGTWRDPRFSPPKDGGLPENALSGNIFKVNGGTTAIEVPADDGKMRLWRNTNIATLAPGNKATLTSGTLGYEWDEDLDNGFRPPGLVRMSSTIVNGVEILQDFGSSYAIGTANHHLTLYKHNSGALVFGSGTIQWSWGLDGNHDRGNTTPDGRMQQATVNLFADMGVQPGSLQSGLSLASASTDGSTPTSNISSPLANANVQVSNPTTITGTASDFGGGVVGAVEVSVDGGNTWHPANGRGNWSYDWTPATLGTVTIKSRAVDDSGNLQTPGTSVTLNVVPRDCPCSIWQNNPTPSVITDPSTNAVELGVKFRSQISGYITGLRFYKGPQNTGTHVGTLWTSGGQQLARATFTNESSSGWQQVSFSQPVAITANTLYVASYHTNVGRYSINEQYFTNSGFNSAPLYALRNGENGNNGVYAYNANPTFPTSSYNASNYWVDVIFSTTAPQDTTPPTVTGTTPASGATGVSLATNVTATFSEAIAPTTVNTNTLELRGANNTLVSGTVSYNSANNSATFTPSSSLALSTTYTVTVKGGTVDPRIKDPAGNALAQNYTWSFTTGSNASSPVSAWDNTATPAVITDPETAPLTLGVKFRTDVSGSITGIKFYKSPESIGVHIGTIWTSSGQKVGEVTFTNETASGWQQVNFPTPIPITANTTYVASYHTNVGKYSLTENYFTSGVDKPPLRLLSNSAGGGNGVYVYSSTPTFPNSSYAASNYWVDVIFNPN
ncbi:hypothetical protein IJ00_24135 [Calothrix sp. 336/3]|nr:hypothetical protein IJ00_24135 [Calothrix sp. 336/3]